MYVAYPVIAFNTDALSPKSPLPMLIVCASGASALFPATLVCGNDKPKPSFGMAVYPAL